MSKNKLHSPDKSTREKSASNKRKIIAGTLMATVALAGAVGLGKRVVDYNNSLHVDKQTEVPGALKNLQHGKINPEDVTVIEADDSSTPWFLAQEVVGVEGDPSAVVSAIVQQSNGHVETGEKFVLNKGYVNPESLAQHGIQTVTVTITPKK